MQIAKEEIAQSKVEGFHDKIIVNDDLSRAYEELEEYVFGKPLSQVEDAVKAGDVDAMDVKEDSSADSNMPVVNGISSDETGLKEAMEITATDAPLEGSRAALKTEETTR